MGDPTAHYALRRSKWVRHETVTQSQLDLVAANCVDAKSLSRELLVLMFTESELSNGCCTGKSKTHPLLDAEILDGIRCK